MLLEHAADDRRNFAQPCLIDKVADHPVLEPFDAETTERPSDDSELAEVFKQTYSGPKEMYA